MSPPRTRWTHEEEFKELEEARQDALEVAQEENAPSDEAEEGPAPLIFAMTTWGHGVARDPSGLQLGMI